MAAGKIVLGALLCALAASATANDVRVEREGDEAKSALVLRASAHVKLSNGHGDVSLRGRLAGRTWRLAAAWSSERGYVRLGAVIATQAAH